MTNLSLFPIERNRYFYGKLLTVRDFELEQKYLNDKRRLLNLAIAGPGVVCGLTVSKSDDMTLMLESGLALDCMGREIVVDAPVIKKLQMLDGFEEIIGKREAFVCLRYREQAAEQVNAVGAQSGENIQYNKFVEGYALSLETGEPDIGAIFDASGMTHTCLAYSANGVRIALGFPVCVTAGEEFAVECIVMKEAGSLPMHFTLDFPSDACVPEEGSGEIHLEFTENALEQKSLYRRAMKLRASPLMRMTVPVASGQALLRLSMGDLQDEVQVVLDNSVYLAAGRTEAEQYLARRDTLARRLEQNDLPIYLARLDLVPAGSSSIISGVTPLPFGQRLRRPQEGGAAGGYGLEKVASQVRSLKYWQKPEVGVSYNRSTGSLDFQFGIPTAQAYDYDTSSGVVEIPMSSGMRVNARYYSDEVPHNLGPGNVSIQLAVEFTEDDQPRLFFGNGEVFRARNGNRAVPQVETGVILYPEKGTFQVGVWLQDTVPGTVLRVRYFAAKVSRDVDSLKLHDRVAIQVLPEVQRVHVRERLRLKALVTGTEDKQVIWELRDLDGGSVDQNGLYQAPDMCGTFEIVARSAADPEAAASTFVIVEE